MSTTGKPKAKPKTRRSAPASDEVVVIKRDSAGNIGERMQSGALILLAGAAAAGTVYFYGVELRGLVEDLLTWAASRIAALL